MENVAPGAFDPADLSNRWWDITGALLEGYGLSEAQLDAISDGYSDGRWRPQELMTRRHFVKMAVGAFEIPLVSPASPSFGDVSFGDPLYRHIEAAAAAGLVEGIAAGRFGPDSLITREQATAVVVRHLAKKKAVDLYST